MKVVEMKHQPQSATKLSFYLRVSSVRSRAAINVARTPINRKVQIFRAMTESSDNVDPQVYKDLQSVEESFDNAEREVLLYQIKLYSPIYEKRDPLLLKIPGFWLSVLEEVETIAEEINFEDTKLLDHLISLKVTRPNLTEPQDFEIEFTFSENEFLDPSSLTLKKYFTRAEGQETTRDEYTSSPVEIKWTKDLTATTSGSRPSFFTFFAWTGLKGDNDLFTYGEEIALLLSDEVYPDALKIWTDAQNIDEEEADDETSRTLENGSVESEDEAEEEEGPPKKKAKSS